MTQTDIYNALSDEQKRLYDFIEDNGNRIYLFEQDNQICAEVENWTDAGVNMVITLMPFCFGELVDYYDFFDIDDEIDIHRQNENYRKTFRISQSLNDFEKWQDDLSEMIKGFLLYA